MDIRRSQKFLMITTYNTESDRQHDQVHITPPGENRRGEGDQPGIAGGAEFRTERGPSVIAPALHTLRPLAMGWDR